MDKLIVIPLNLFTITQEVLIVDETGTHTFTHVDLANLPEVITEASKAYGIENVKLIGNVNYAEALSHEINEYEAQNYSKNSLKISIVEA